MNIIQKSDDLRRLINSLRAGLRVLEGCPLSYAKQLDHISKLERECLLTSRDDKSFFQAMLDKEAS